MATSPGFVGGAFGSGTRMNVWEKTRGWPSIDLAGVFGGFPEGPRPCVTFPDTVTSSDGGCVPTKERKCVSKGTKSSNSYEGLTRYRMAIERLHFMLGHGHLQN